MTREIIVQYHEEPEGWWAETEAVAGFSAAGATFTETRTAVVRALASLFPAEDLRIITHRVYMDNPAFLQTLRGDHRTSTHTREGDKRC